VNGEHHRISLVEAVFMSPLVFPALQTDKTVRLLEITDTGIDQIHFQALLNLLHGKPVKVTASSRLSLFRLSRHLENRDLTRLFLCLPDEDTIIQSHETVVAADLTAETRANLLSLDVDTLEMILISHDLRILSGDWLLDLILELGPGSECLLKYVKYEFLSSEVDPAPGVWVGDPSLKSFLFTLSNPQNVSPRRFEVDPSVHNYILHSDSDNCYVLWMGYCGAITEIQLEYGLRVQHQRIRPETRKNGYVCE
jgi:hypothetical protein